jgi:hypothetical protein
MKKQHSDNGIGMIKIDKGVPLPRARNTHRYPFEQMRVGDSFLTPAKITSLSAVLAHWGIRLKRKFASRTVKGGTRVWRVE